MMYSNNLAFAIKSRGKVLREFGDKVYLPFGSEYSILIKNLENKRVSVNVSIDGKDIAEGISSFVIDAKGTLELERFVRNANLNEGNRFKFIERTESIEKHRGIELEDGLVQVDYRFEDTESWKKYVQWTHSNIWYHGDTSGHYYGDPNINVNSVMRGVTGGTVSTNSVWPAGSVPCNSTTTASTNLNDAGITVPGSESQQQFHTTWAFPTESTKHTMVIKLLGQMEHKPVIKPVTVKTQQTCSTCGRRNKAVAKFCTECGTALQLI